MSLKPIKNNVTRMLDKLGIQYQTHKLPNQKLGAREVADFLKVDPKLVFKTIVFMNPHERKYILAVVPGTHEVNPKALARTLSKKKIIITKEKDAEKITGLQSGGISPLALLHRGFEVILDNSAETKDEIIVSGGQRGLNIRLNTQDFIEITRAKLAKISR
jgi:Cys-tRNA(Pro)/Cys-tRNA(Cys) deacylase